MTRQNKIRQDETRESKTSKAKTKGDKTSQGNARQTQKRWDNTEKNIDGDWFTLGRTSRPGSKQRKTNEVKRRQGKTRQDKPRDKTRYCPTTNNKKTSEELASKAGEDKTRVDMTRQIEKCVGKEDSLAGHNEFAKRQNLKAYWDMWWFETCSSYICYCCNFCLRDSLESSCGPKCHQQILKIAPFHTGAENWEFVREAFNNKPPGVCVDLAEDHIFYVRIIRCNTELLGLQAGAENGNAASSYAATKKQRRSYAFTKKPTTNKLASWLESRPREAPNNKPPRGCFV